MHSFQKMLKNVIQKHYLKNYLHHREVIRRQY